MDQNEKEETHQEVPRGWFFPVHLISLYQEETINAEELMLLGTINSLQKAKLGCVASNRWLAKKWNKTRDHVSATLSKLTKLGLIICECDEKGHRRIFVTFGGDPDPREKSLPPSGKIPTPPREKSLGHLRRQVREQEIHSAFPNSRCSSEAAGVLNGEEMPPIKWVNQLKAHLKKSHVFQISLFNEKRWCHHFKKLLVDLDGNANRISRVMDRYVSKQADYRPSVYDAFGFRKNFGKIENWTNDGRPFVPKREVVEIKGTKRVMKKGQTILDIDPTYDG